MNALPPNTRPPARPQLLERIDRQPTRGERFRAGARRAGKVGAITAGVIVLLIMLVLARAYLESRWTLPETSITTRIEEDLYYNITYEPNGNDILGINYTTDQIVHLGNPEGGVEGVQARVERNLTENRHAYQLKNERDILVASSTEVRVSNRPVFDKTALVSHVEHAFSLDPTSGARTKQWSSYVVRGKRLHEQTSTVVVESPSGEPEIVSTLIEYSEWHGWFGDRARSGTRLIEYSRATPRELVTRVTREHNDWHGQQRTRMDNPFPEALDALSSHARPLFRTDEGLPGPWWQLDTLPQGSTVHLYAGDDDTHKINIAWDKTGFFPWRWLNGGYRARDKVGELFRVQIRDFWFHFPNQLVYAYFLDLNGDGDIDKETELIGQVNYGAADSPLRESFERKPDVALTQEHTQEFTRNKTFVFRVGVDPSQAERDFLLCDAIEKLLTDAIIKGFGRDSHLAYIERARDDFILSQRLDGWSLHSAASPNDALAWKEGVVTLLEAARRPYVQELEQYYFGDSSFPTRQ